jgi:hypothetical protein
MKRFSLPITIPMKAASGALPVEAFRSEVSG